MFLTSQSKLTKVDKLDIIAERIENIEKKMKDFKHSLSFLLDEVDEVKQSIAREDKEMTEIKHKVTNTDQVNSRLSDAIVDLQARSMRDNLIIARNYRHHGRRVCAVRTNLAFKNGDD